MNESILELDNLSKSFGGVRAVNGLSFTVPKGSIFGLMGPNGAGKTTAINLITGFFSPDSGDVKINGANVTGLASHKMISKGVARTYQNVRLFKGMTAVEQVITGAFIRRTSSSWERILVLRREHRELTRLDKEARVLLARVGLKERHDELAENLPYGDQRRVEIARALAGHPSLLLLDEPTAGMNHEESVAIGELMQQLRGEGVTIFVIEHNMRLVLDHCDHVAVQNFGTIIATGTPQECVAAPEVQEAYFGRKSDAERVKALRQLRVD